MVSRRKFLGGLLGSAGIHRWALGSSAESNLSEPLKPRIDRRALVARHNPRLRKLNPLSPFTLGNGEFAFTADITSLQTIPAEYETGMPLCTMSQWGWHTEPRGFADQALRLTQYDTHGRLVGYHTDANGQEELFTWLRENPHRFHLGRIGLQLTSANEIQAADLSDVDQKLDLWLGVLTSEFKLKGTPVRVTTAVHPHTDLLAIVVESALIENGGLSLRVSFPYASPRMQAANWDQIAKHQTEKISQTRNRLDLHRKLDLDQYFVSVQWDTSAMATLKGPHTLWLTPAGHEASRLECVVAFSPTRMPARLPSVAGTFNSSTVEWQKFWTEGGAVDLSQSNDSRALELERRVVLSQYLTRIQCAGSKPPQETGLTVNSWFGKFHLEMHWWHAAHFALWNRLSLFEKSLGWYVSILPKARALARSQGYSGARWPKMVGPEGRDSPSPIGPLLIWQQPHPIFYAELCYQAHPSRATLDRYSEVVFASATFMSSYAFFEEGAKRYVLGPPLIPAQENHPPRETWNPTFELAYWAFGLRLAQRWRERLGLKRNVEWDQVLNKLSALPVREGFYLAHENCPKTYTDRNFDHPSMLGALGMLPGNDADRETMRRTLFKTMKEWKWDQTWGWDYPLTAMTAARLGETKIAIDSLLMNTEKNRYLPNGHNWQRPNLPCYLPGNGGLLYAIGMMAAGWPNAPGTHAPGFPRDGSWTVRWEDLKLPIA
jgi:protein-glucosylgalactosylhydroxylysine glucosidase